jgi:lipoprotein NlpD
MFVVLAVLAVLLTGCASSGSRAPVIERGQASRIGKPAKSTESDTRPRVYVVQKGDTLYAIAFNYGLDPRELAEQNHIQDPNLIQIGQQINLVSVAAEPHPVVEHRPVQSLLKDQPRVVKYVYSETAVAKAEAVQGQPEVKEARVPDKVDSKPVVRVDKPEVKPVVEGDDALEWSMPTQGRVTGSFSEADNRKGVDISGKLGQPIFASAPGKVVYSGSGLRGYGKLLIVKHNNTYISAYAHNDQLLVKEGDTVTRGQKIAEMGNTDSEGGKVELHFEVRRFGKPVDPANYLSFNKP